MKQKIYNIKNYVKILGLRNLIIEIKNVTNGIKVE